MNKFTKSSKSFLFKVLLLSILYTGIPSVSNATTLSFTLTVELAVNAITGMCKTKVMDPPNPITFEHDCDLVVRLAGNSIHLLDSDDIDESEFKFPNMSSITFISLLEEIRVPSVNNTYCVLVGNVKVRNSAGQIVAQHQPGMIRCKIFDGQIV